MVVNLGQQPNIAGISNMKVFNIQDVIKLQCDKEALAEWSKKKPTPLPKYKKEKVIKNSAGWLNFSINIIKELRP